ncbi:hypothetical protein Bca52824_080068 [Brassica carinata]|uniref:RRM domain-containing protein n=1 Tax=Brassica carinata TaxID=52824 RepID=A0A8X7U0P6_BRACI|nr:hypothetical protein Bca52824_080068 [Brassica carinata]
MERLYVSCTPAFTYMQVGRSRHVDESYQKPTKTLYVCNFDPFKTKEVHIEEHFEPYGKVINVRIRSNYSFVQFATQEDATKALEATQRSQILGKVISVEYALKDDDERDDRRGGGCPKRSLSPEYHMRPIPDYGVLIMVVKELLIMTDTDVDLQFQEEEKLKNIRRMQN